MTAYATEEDALVRWPGQAKPTGADLARLDTLLGVAASQLDRAAERDWHRHPQTGTEAWLATGGGVSRFDGQEFANITMADGLASGFVNGLVREPGGVLWVATVSGGIGRHDPAEHKTRMFTTKDGLLSDWVTCAAREQSAAGLQSPARSSAAGWWW